MRQAYEARRAAGANGSTDDITMRAYQVGDVRELPQLSLGKDNQNSRRTQSTNDPSDLTQLKGEKVTLVQASNIGVSKAAQLGIEGLSKPAHLPYEVHYATSEGNDSPRRTPSAVLGRRRGAAPQPGRTVADFTRPA
ncbi:hypothetical protein ACWCQW_45435 [Streptomyces mirabilis]